MAVEVTTAEIASSLSGTRYLLGYSGSTFQRYSPSLLVGNGATGKLAQYTASGLLEDSGVASSAVLLSSGTYSDPAWLTALAASKVTGTLPIAAGGTGQTTAAAALGALLPAQAGQGGKVLGTDGSSAGWTTPSGGTPGGSSGQIQWNNAGAFAGASALKTDGSSLLLGTGAMSVGTSGTGVLVLGNSTAPTSAPADEVQLFSSDYAAGDARLRVLSEIGTGLWVGNGTIEAMAPASGAGNSLTLRASDATSGNTNGGNVILVAGTGSGSGVTGSIDATGVRQILVPAGTSSVPSIQFLGTNGFYSYNWMGIGIICSSLFGVFLSQSMQFNSGTAIGWSNTSDPTLPRDTALHRGAPGVIRLSSGTTGPGGMSSAAQTPAQITADQNNYSPGAGLFQRWSSDASRNVTGVVAGVDGETRYVWNVGTQNIVLQNENASSTAANRMRTSTGADLTLSANKCALMMYSTTTSRWLVTLLP